MQSLLQFTQFEIDSTTTKNINGGGFASADLRSNATTSRFRVIGRRFGKRNTTLLDGTNLNSLGDLSSYSSYDGTGYEQALEEATSPVLETPVSENYEPHIIL